MNNWISVKESLPNLFERVLVFGNYGIFTGYLAGSKQQDWIFNPESYLVAGGVTHWMYLPESPEDSDE